MRLTRMNRQVFEQFKNMQQKIDLNKIKTDVIYKKFTEINSWYTKIIGLDEVKLYQDRVTSLQERLLEAQEKRRTVSQELVSVRQKSNDLQEQLHKVKRQEDLQRFLELMREETEILKREQQVSKAFSECDREEREIFSAFTNSIRDSQEKQRSQIEYTKYLGLILSITGSFLVFVYSTLRKEDLKRFIKENVASISVTTVPTLMQLQENQKQLSKIVHRINEDNEKVLKLISTIHSEVNNRPVTNAFNSLKSSAGFGHASENLQYDDNSKVFSTAIKYGLGAFVCFLVVRSIF